LDEAKQLIFKMIADGPLLRPSEPIFDRIIRANVQAREFGQALEMVMLLESIGLYTCRTLLYDSSNSSCINIAEKILEEAKKKDSKLIIALLYHTLIFRYCDGRVYEEAVRLYTQMRDFGVALKFMIEMKDFGLSVNLDEYHKVLHSLYLKAMDRKLMTEQLEEMDPMDREMAKDQLVKMSSMDSRTIKEKLEEMNLDIRASFS
jgi:pentatricopeptide repeat protein